MGRMVGCLVTWTTYGTWLQGDERGYVKDGEVLKKNEQLRRDNEQRLIKGAVRLSTNEKKIVETAIRKEAEKNEIGLEALAVCSNHVHVVFGYCEQSIEEVVGRFKNAGRAALKNAGIERKIWTKGYDKRFCYDEDALKNRIRYVDEHND